MHALMLALLGLAVLLPASGSAQDMRTWQKLLRITFQPGCFQASHPVTQWMPVPCAQTQSQKKEG